MVTVITPQQLREMYENDEDFVLLDVLAEKYFRKQHIPGALNIQVADIKEVVPKIVRKDRTIVVYCYDIDCGASPQAAKILEQLGYENILDLEEGIVAYKEAGYSVARF